MPTQVSMRTRKKVLKRERLREMGVAVESVLEERLLGGRTDID